MSETERIAALTDRNATCRHCGRHIFRTTTCWIDADGFTACVKGKLGVPHSFVVHQPMPAGLQGAPS